VTTCIRRPHTVWTTCTEQAEAELARLKALGWSHLAIGSACGLFYRSIDRNVRSQGAIGPVNAAKIINHGDPTEGSVGATGTSRRLRGLAVQGFTLQRIEADTGIGWTTLGKIRQGNTGSVRAQFYTTIRDYTAAHEMIDGGNEDAKRYARRKKWAGLLAYDDIDDPAETPIGVPRDRKRTA
jgi:hypothetical protein